MFGKVHIQYARIYTVLNTMVRESMIHVTDRTLGVYWYGTSKFKFPSVLAANYVHMMMQCSP